MNRDTLKKLMIEFKKSLGYLDRPTDNPNAILFTKGEIQELVYVHELGEENILSGVLTRLAQTYKRVPEQVGRIFITPIPLGRPPESVQQNGFKYQVPIWFFDKEFSTLKASTPLKVLEEEVRKYEYERITQPFICEGKEGSDLLGTLGGELVSPQQPCLRIILAPAGYGKTVLMASLYSKLKDKFLDEKQRQHLSMRPIIMLPGHVGRASELDELINNFINSEYTFGEASVDTFKFWINNNFAVWLLDGVEELLIKNPEECMFSLLDEYIVRQSYGNPQIIIAIRKSLLATSPELKKYIEEWKECIKVYELKEWGNEEKRKYFEQNLTIQTEEITNFITEVVTSPTLNQLCDVPYFCHLINELKNNKKFRIFNNKCELIKYTFEKFCDREFDKGLDREIFSIDDQLIILSELASESFQGNAITKKSLKDWAEILTGHLSEDSEQQQINCFLRHALFTQIDEKIDFAHEIIKEYLVAVYLLDKLKSNKVTIFDKKEIEYESFLLDFLVKNLPNNIAWGEVINNVTQIPCSQKDEAIAFRNILKILTKSNYPHIEDVIKDFLSCKNLRTLKFKDLKMIEFNFQNSNLELVTFEGCNLEKANFNGCIFKETTFNDSLLTHATTKGSYFISISINNKYIDDQKEIMRTLYKITELTVEPTNEPCQALIGLIEILKKLIRKPKGFEIPIQFLLGTKCGGGIPASTVVDALIKENILFLSRREKHVKINVSLYENIKDFVNVPGLEKLREIKNVLDKICRETKMGCKHFYTGK